MNRPIYQIAKEIRRDWTKLSPCAKPYLDAMDSISDIQENYIADTARDVVLRFLCNATGWRGETARRVKKELKSLLGE